ncbi:1,4-alpha-glucan branching protein GlgB [Shewanella sp. SR44-3]|uniref:1,4-alpha-glucan branching protein GlgB n=1 Tax=Shewanella sp. SR44-3 TaxID=2760936 RepID=UPI0021757BEE|nr:1,4-alpha-glucan branching protein GlgB [Shewanella sp. SR44-3]
MAKLMTSQDKQHQIHSGVETLETPPEQDSTALEELRLIQAFLNLQLQDVFSFLGLHSSEHRKGLTLRCFLPGALNVDLLDKSSGRKVASLTQFETSGLFSSQLRRVNPFAYQLRVTYGQCERLVTDPYQFNCLLQDDDVYLFNEGQQLQAYRFQGANWRQYQGVTGVHFCVWAPNASKVSLVGDFNQWDRRQHQMRRHIASGLWDIFITDVEPGEHYKFAIEQGHGHWEAKADPYAVSMEGAPGNAAIIPAQAGHSWQDDNWLAKRTQTAWHKAPISIYEVHLGSWRRNGEDGGFQLQYQQLIDELIPYVLDMGFTHVQLMPLSEYPFEGSWGYQPVGLYAPSHRFGNALALKAFIDACHQAGIGVLLDWVVAHFPRDPHGLKQFDGTYLYEHQDPRRGEHPDWDTLIFNYGRAEVRSFLLSNANYWLSEFHIDGLRIDAVSSMLYLDYSREEAQWLPNEHGGRENLEAIEFLQQLNASMYAAHSGIVMIAEESTAWPGVTQATSQQGLGFGFKWNMGWMNDTLSYLKRDPIYRCHHHNELTFGLMYAFSEQFILSVSHDEVVHGKGSLLHKIPGDDWQKFATLRAYYGFMWGHPGKKLLFMGGEFGQRDEWNHDKSLDWHLLQYAPHKGLQAWVRTLNALYQAQEALYLTDTEASGFRWLDCENTKNSILVFMRTGAEPDSALIFIINMTPTPHDDFRVGVPKACQYYQVANSDSAEYGGSNLVMDWAIPSESMPWQGMDNSLLLTVPPLSCVVLSAHKVDDTGSELEPHLLQGRSQGVRG